MQLYCLMKEKMLLEASKRMKDSPTTSFDETPTNQQRGDSGQLDCADITVASSMTDAAIA